MLNLAAIDSAMRKLGLNGKALADACGVSKEATSNWLNGESIPRPSKLARLAEVLGIPVESLLSMAQLPAPVFAYRTKLNKPVTGLLREAAEEQARHLEQLLPFVEATSEFEPPLMRNPSLEEERIRHAANAVRSSLNLSHTDVLSNAHLESLFRTFGAILVPVLWGLNKEKHENALTVYLPESKTSWVVFNLGCKQDDYKYWLAHEYGHCLTLHGLSEEDGEIFAEKFAQHLVFPDEVANECLEKIRLNGDGRNTVKAYAESYEISVITVLRAVDRLSEQLFGQKTGLDTKSFYAAWNATRKTISSMANVIFGSDAPLPQEYVEKSEALYKTPVFRALENFQTAEGGRNPAFVANTLNIGLGDAVSLSLYLWERQC
ncbi:helix-turn-helix domain-containing protein [Dechloromonas denitrificans]|nr:helix-turn-helix domain-containing protein [Dechloromonas denitrificans]